MTVPLDPETLLKIEEFKEVGHEYRYREQLMVQEFSLCMVATSVIVGAILSQSGTIFSLIAQCFGQFFLCLLTLHLRNINQDRRAALLLKEEILEQLKFRPIHQNVGERQRQREFIRISAPRAMVWFAASLSVAWLVWTVASAIRMLW